MAPRQVLLATGRLAHQLGATSTMTATTSTARLLSTAVCRQCGPFRARTAEARLAKRSVIQVPSSGRTFAVTSAYPATFCPSAPVFGPPRPQEKTILTDSQYHELADKCLERLLARLEAMQDAREDVDVEYSSGVLTLALVDGGTTRTYVINKQPPNKQIWLSSPTSGPKRYDWVDDAWVYLKDGSQLNDLLRVEIGVDLDAPDEEEL